VKVGFWHKRDVWVSKLPAVKLPVVEFAGFRAQAIHSNQIFGVYQCNSIFSQNEVWAQP